ncbi:MAG: holo-ACP synthase [Oscillospiraceae bacterium]
MVDKVYTGIDLVEIDRIRNSIQRDANFLMRYFGNEEIKLFSTKNATERIAANFAAKEAFSKALGTGIVGFSLKEVETLRDENGAPFLHLSGKAKEIAEKRQLQFSVSLSHTKDYATAIVIGYTNSQRG